MVDIITTGVGWHESRVPTITTSVPRSAFTFLTCRLKLSDLVSVFLCATNCINSPDVDERVLERGDANLISMARPFLADPDIMKKGREGRDYDINSCIAYNKACIDQTFVGRTASCLVNPRACHETELIINEDMIPKYDRLNIGVIGSGPASLAFTTTSARVGHRVNLYDRSENIGGQFNMARRIPGNEEFNETIHYFLSKIKKLDMGEKLRVELEADITYGDMEHLSSSSSLTAGGGEGEVSEGVDRWIVATGIDPRIHPIPSLDHPNVLSYVDFLILDTDVGDRVSITEAGRIGFDVVEFLIH